MILASSVGLEPLEQAERLERGDALGRRRQLDDLVVPVVDAQRLDPARREAGQVVLVEPARRADRPADRPAVEGGRARPRRSGAASRRAPGGARAAARLRRRPELGRRGRVRARPGGRGDAADREAPLGRVDRVGETRVEAEPAEALGERGPAADGARHRHRARTALVDGLERVRAGGRRARRVERREPRSSPDEGEAVAADPGGHRLGHAQHGRGGERRVGRVPAALEHPQAGAGRERLARRDHPAGRDRGWPPGGEAERHRAGIVGRAARIGRVTTLYTRPAAPTAPACGIVLGEKGIAVETRAGRARRAACLHPRAEPAGRARAGARA